MNTADSQRTHCQDCELLLAESAPAHAALCELSAVRAVLDVDAYQCGTCSTVLLRNAGIGRWLTMGAAPA